MTRILITGSSGLVGTALRKVFAARGVPAQPFDIRGTGSRRGDVRELSDLVDATSGCSGIIHLAAVSRVIWGEQDPDLCVATNVGGVTNVLRAAAQASQKPWVIFASSREVYGEPVSLPVAEDSSLAPLNIYGRTKHEGERLVEAARRDGVRACTVRLSNVFGSIADHHDRVVPAFARGAIEGRELRVDGADHTFDFTFVEDVVEGIVWLADMLDSGSPPPEPIHFVSGEPTTLGELAQTAIELADSSSTIRYAPPRNFDVTRFYGDPTRAREILGWEHRTTLREGLGRLIGDFRDAAVRPGGTR